MTTKTVTKTDTAPHDPFFGMVGTVHEFHPEDAMDFGVDGAILLARLRFIVFRDDLAIRRGEQVEGLIRDGRLWVRWTREGLSKQFPFWTPKQSRTILSNLVKTGAVECCKAGVKRGDQALYFSQRTCLDPGHELNLHVSAACVTSCKERGGGKPVEGFGEVQGRGGEDGKGREDEEGKEPVQEQEQERNPPTKNTHWPIWANGEASAHWPKWANGADQSKVAVAAALVQQVFEAWNVLSGRCCVKSALDLTPARRRKTNARLREPFFAQHWQGALAKVRDSAFLTGINDRKWTASFDWFIQPDSVARIMEGKYDSRSAKAGGRKFVSLGDDIPGIDDPI